MQFIFKVIGGIFLIFILIGLYLTYLGTSDLRTPTVLENPQANKAAVIIIAQILFFIIIF